MAENGDLYFTASKWKVPVLVFFRDARLVFKMDSLGMEILRIAFPAALALAADPIASLIDTVFIGHIAVMQTDGFEYLKESCPSVLIELLEYVAKVSEHSVIISRHGNEAILDGSDVNGRWVKQRL